MFFREDVSRMIGSNSGFLVIIALGDRLDRLNLYSYISPANIYSACVGLVFLFYFYQASLPPARVSIWVPFGVHSKRSSSDVQASQTSSSSPTKMSGKKRPMLLGMMSIALESFFVVIFEAVVLLWVGWRRWFELVAIYVACSLLLDISFRRRTPPTLDASANTSESQHTTTSSYFQASQSPTPAETVDGAEKGI